MKIESVEKTHVGLVRSENQDALFTAPGNGVYLVADGMGGEKAGAEASAQVVDSIRKATQAYFKSGKPESPRALESMMRDSLVQANRDVFEISVREPDKTGLGSTSSLLCVHRGVYFIAHVGDSRIYLLREGSVTQLTRDHTVVWALYENDVITRDQLETHPDRHLLTQCMGTPKKLEVDSHQGAIQAGDVFMMCSDGLTGYAGEDEVSRLMIEEGAELEACAEKLEQAALDGGGGDNVTVVMARVIELEEGDDWTPELTPQPKKLPLPAQDEDDTISTGLQTPPNAKKLWAIGAVVAIAVIAAIMMAVGFGRSEPISVQVELPELVDVESEFFVAYLEDADGAQSGAEISNDGSRGALTFSTDGPGDYDLHMRGPGFVDVQKQLAVSEEGENSFMLIEGADVHKSWTLQIVCDAAEIGSIVIVREKMSEGRWGKESSVYRYPNDSDPPGEPRMRFELIPGNEYRHLVEMESAADPPRPLPTETFRVSKEGRTRTLKPSFD